MKTLMLALVLLLMPFSACAKSPLKAAQESYVQLTDLQEDHMCGATLVEDKRTVYTAAHCVDRPFLVEGQIPLSVVIDDRDHAIIKLRYELDKTPAKWGKAPGMGDAVYIYGRPLGLGPLYREGIYSGYQMEGGVRVHILQLFGAPGDSGSGLFDADGRLIGTVSFGIGIAPPFSVWGPIGYMDYNFIREH